MKSIQLEETLQLIEKLQQLLKKLDENSALYEEMLLLLSRAEKQRDELYRLDERGKRFVEQVKLQLDLTD